MIGAAVDALGGGVRAETVDLHWHGWFCEALEAWVRSGCVQSIAADATAFRVGVTFRTAM